MKKIAAIALDGAMTSSLADLPDIARTANIFISERIGKAVRGERLIDNKPARFVWDFLSIDGRAPTGMAAMTLRLTGSIADASEPYDLVFVPALSHSTPEMLNAQLAACAPLYPWLREQWQRGAVIAAVGVGTALLAEAGLLDQRAATTSRWLENLFRQRYPAVLLDVSRDITEQDCIYCAAELSVNTRLSLLLMARFLSSDISNMLAKSVVSNARRAVLPPRVLSPGSAETVLDVDDELVARAQYWFQKNMAEKVSLTDAADSLLVSGKTLARHFKKALGITPHAYLQGIRMDTAKSMLLYSDMSVDTIAERVGYRDLSFFQQIFRKHTGFTPTLYRKRGRAASQG